MNTLNGLSRRKFVGGMAATLGLLGLRPDGNLLAQGRNQVSASDYDGLAKLSFNENPYGPPESVITAMTQAFKYANRYGYPDGNIVEVIATHHEVGPENVLLGAGSTEILDVVATAFLPEHKKVVGAEPTFGTVYEFATGLKAGSIKLPLRADYREDIPAMIKAAKENHQEVGFVYLCNPNNPTGAIVPKAEVKQLLDEIPEGMPVLIDEAYHHFVEDANYETSVPYVIAGRPVIVARTFSKIAAMAGMRLGYAIAPAGLIEQMRPHSSGFSVSAVAKWGGVAALKDTQAQADVKRKTLDLRKKTTGELEDMGYSVIPSEANFFMVQIRRQVGSVIGEFRKRGVLVGRPFPPMLEHMRVSVGTADEMSRFMAAFKEILGTTVGMKK
jgi:histidinol-phosphate aminotransferase